MRGAGAAMVLGLVLVHPVAAQEKAPLPGHMLLEEDVVEALDLGASPAIPMGHRTAEGRVVGAPYLCRTAAAAGRQEPPAGLEAPTTLLGRPAADVEPWLSGLAPEGVHVVVTPHAVVVGLLSGARAPALGAELLARLRVFFPDLGETPARLTGLQQTHLWTLRLLQVEAVLTDMVERDPAGRLQPPEGARRLLGHQRFEIYLASNTEIRKRFAEHVLPRDAAPQQGVVLEDVDVPVPVGALVVADPCGPEERVRFRFAAASLSLLRQRRLPGGPPDWLRIGTAHLVSRLHPEQARVRDAGDLPPGEPPIRSWKRHLKNLVLADRLPTPRALCWVPARAMDRTQHVASWGLVRYLLGVGRSRFADLVSRLYHIPPGAGGSDPVEEALEVAYGVDLEGLARGWRLWVRSL